MSLRFRRRVKLLPGLWVNLSKTGASLSAGVKGFTVNSGRGKVKTTISAPGTGLSYSASAAASDVANPRAPSVRPLVWFALLLALCVSAVYVFVL